MKTTLSRSELEGVMGAFAHPNLRFRDTPREQGKWTTFTITVNDCKEEYGKVNSHTGRRVGAACWHAHLDFLDELFDQYPDAQVWTAVARYNGQDEFLDKAPDTAYHEVGSMMFPRYIVDECECNRGAA